MNVSFNAACAEANLAFSCKAETASGATVFQAMLRNPSAGPIQAAQGVVCIGGVEFGGKFSVISCGDSMGMPGERYDFPGCTHHITSDGYLLFRFANGRHLLAGVLRCCAFLPEWSFVNGALSLTLFADCRILTSGETLGPDTFAVIEADSLYKVMHRYGELLTQYNPRAERTVPTLWHGFGMWGEHTGEEYLDAFRICKNVYSQDLNLLQVDAGYCYWGDWLDVWPHLYPDGFWAFVQHIRQENAYTGLWAAPFLAEVDSRLFREHPEYLLKKGDGTPYLIYSTGKILGVLDFSQDEVCDWWEHIITVMRRQWDIPYFKFDFLRYELMPLQGKHSMTPNERYQRFLDITNRVFGDDTFLLACTAPFSPTFGRCDAFRLGADITETWPRLLGSARTCAGHAVFHNHPAIGDCDYVQLRGPDTPPSRLGHKHGTLSLDEAKMWAQFETMFNHIVLAADDPAALEEERKELVRKVLAGEPCDEIFTMDPFAGDGSLPPSLFLTSKAGRTELHFYNWSEETQQFRILDADGSVFCTETLEPHTSSMKILANPRSFGELAVALRPDSKEVPRALCTPKLECFPCSGKMETIPLDSIARHSITMDRNGGMMVHEGIYGKLARKQIFCGVPFDLSSDRAVQYGYGETTPLKLPLGRKADRLYFLHSAMYPTKGELMKFVFHYADGSQVVEPILLKEDIGNSTFFYSRPWQGTRAKVAWCDPYTGDVLYVFRWENPHPKLVLDTLEFQPLAQMGEWNLLAITAET